MSTFMSITHVNQLRKLHLQSSSFESFIYRALASKASFIELQLRKLHLQSSSFESFIYRALASKASFTKVPASKTSFTKLRLQSFTYKASVHGIQKPHPNNRHFGLYMD
ncbi:hypothetical protein ACFX2G_027310 [Malus domestica]